MLEKTSKEELLKSFNTSETIGLTKEEVKKRQERDGLNELEEKKKVPLVLKFLAQFKDLLIIILLIAAVVSVVVDPSEYIESIIILVVVILNAVLSVVQESRAEKSLDALKKMSQPLSKVLRDGNVVSIPSNEIVVGDIIIVEAGDIVPADARLIEASNLKVDESALTGESLSVNKTSELIDKENVSLGDMKNMIFTSTFVTYGRGKAIVTSTGMNTEIGKIANMLLKSDNKQTPLQIRLDQIGKIIGFISIAICVIVFVIEMLAEQDMLEAFKTAVALAVAAIPEGLATVVTIVLAIGVKKMADEKAIVKKLPAVETLGCASVVCSDKTGTLTENKMTVVKVFSHGIKDVSGPLDEKTKMMLTYFSLCTDASISIVDGVEKRVGDPTETALIEANNKYGLIENAPLKFPRVADLSFDSDRKMMSVIVKYEGHYLIITKGAPDIVISRSKKCDYLKEGLTANFDMAKNALRCLAVGIKEIDSLPSELCSDTIETDLEFIGLVGMIDPARKEVKDAIRLAKSASVKTVMITGDHVITATAIAKELEILKDESEAISSDELGKLSDDELFANIEKYSVYARVSPSDKVRIVKAWQRKDQVVAMTGDGVNDSPALKQADIGCAMGITGTDVAKEAAAMILVDDNYSTIIKAIREGRGIYDNIKKCVNYLLSSNIGEVLSIFVAACLSAFTSLAVGNPLLAVHLLWVNLITDSLPAFALGMEEPEKDVMNRSPRPKHESFFANHVGLDIAILGVIIGGLTLTAYLIGNAQSHVIGQTMAFMTLATTQLFHSFNMKSSKSIFNKNLFKNKWLVGSFVIGLGLQLMILYVPAFAKVFSLIALPFGDLMVVFGLSFSIIILVEIKKLFFKIIGNKKNK